MTLVSTRHTNAAISIAALQGTSQRSHFHETEGAAWFLGATNPRQFPLRPDNPSQFLLRPYTLDRRGRRPPRVPRGREETALGHDHDARVDLAMVVFPLVVKPEPGLVLVALRDDRVGVVRALLSLAMLGGSPTRGAGLQDFL